MMQQLFSALGVVDSWVVIIYILAIIGIGVYCSHFIKDTKDFSSAGQSLGLFVIVGATLSSFFGAYTGSGGLEVVHNSGLAGFTICLGGNVGLLILGLMGKRLRSSGALTYPQFISMSYGEKTRIAASGISMIYLIGQVSGQFVACGTIASMLGLCSFGDGILIGGVIIILLTVFGGLVSVAWTGAVQQIFITVLCIIVVPFIAFREAGGIANTFLLNGPDRTSMTAGLPPSYLWGMFFSIVLSFAAEPAYAQRIFAAKDVKTAVRGSLISNGLSVLMCIPLYVSVLTLFVISPDTQGSAFVPYIMNTYFPPVLKGFGIAAFISILLTTADTMLMTTSSIFTTDIWPMIAPKSSDRTMLRVGRIFVVCMGVLAIIMGVYFQSVYTVMLLFAGAYGSAVFPCIVFAVISKEGKNPVDHRVLPFAIVVTFCVTALMDLIPSFPTEGIFVGLPLNVIILLIGSKLIRQKA